MRHFERFSVHRELSKKRASIRKSSWTRQDAMLIAARKHYRPTKTTSRRWIRRPAPSSSTPSRSGGVGRRPGARNGAGEARRIQPRRSRFRDPHPEKHRSAGPHFGANRQAGHFPEGPRSRRETVYQEYSGRTGELVNCTIKRVEGRTNSGPRKTEAKLPRRSSRAWKATAGRPRSLRDPAGGQGQQRSRLGGIARRPSW